MNKTSFILSLIFLFLATFQTAQAAVWTSDKEWSSEWEQKYSNWIASSVGPKFFKELGAPFDSLKIDCADAHYALLAYFARANGLHLRINKGNTTNQITRFDNIANSNKRLVAFINYMSGSFGTEALAHNDTIPVGIGSVKPGDLFMYKIRNSGEFIRHTYLVKNINIDGTFDVLYSTQARRDNGQPLNRYASYMFKKAPFNTGLDKYHWGFRRQKKSSVAHINQEDSPEADFSQYNLAFNLLNSQGSTNGRLAFFREVRRVNQTVNESPNRVSERNFSSICHSVQDRVEAVQAGVNKNNALGGKCMSYEDYDAYSTPSRDSGIKDEYRSYNYDVAQVGLNNLNRYNAGLFSSVFKATNLTGTEISNLRQACPVATSIGEVDLGNFRYDLMVGQTVSFHPNDNIYRRWGGINGDKTRCEEYYGYPN